MNADNTTGANGAGRRSARNWKRPTTELTLPSGFTVTVQRPPLMAWIKSGRIPEELLGVAARAHGRGLSRGAVEEAMTGDTLKAAMDAMDMMVAGALVWPRVVEGYGENRDDEITREDIPDEDAGAIVSWVMGLAAIQTTGGEVGADALKTFSPEQELSAGGGGGEDVRAEAVGAPGGAQ